VLRVIVIGVLFAGCARPPCACTDLMQPDSSTWGTDAFRFDGGSVVDAPASMDAPASDLGTDAASSPCNVGSGHTCLRWVTTQPNGERACLGYDGLGVVCASPPTTSCDVGSGHSCSRWVQTQPNGEWACLGYDGFGTTCASPPGASCDVGSGHSCSRWVETQPNGEWACLGYDGLGTVCM
jgi:hypothetical protein